MSSFLYSCGLSILAALSIQATPIAASKPPETPWYMSVQTGFAWSMDAKTTTNSDWTEITENMNGDLGNAPFLTLEVGRRWISWFTSSVAYTYYQTFHFQKHVTTVDPSVTTAQRMRFFDLEAQNCLFRLAFDPSEHICPSLGKLMFIPIFGGGIGVGINAIGHFLQVAYDSSTDVGSVISIGQPKTSVVLAWQGFCAIRMKPKYAHFSFDIGYRYENFGKFATSDNIMINNSAVRGQISQLSGWSGRLQTNAVYLACNAGW